MIHTSRFMRAMRGAFAFQVLFISKLEFKIVVKGFQVCFEAG